MKAKTLYLTLAAMVLGIQFQALKALAENPRYIEAQDFQNATLRFSVAQDLLPDKGTSDLKKMIQSADGNVKCTISRSTQDRTTPKVTLSWKQKWRVIEYVGPKDIHGDAKRDVQRMTELLRNYTLLFAMNCKRPENPSQADADACADFIRSHEGIYRNQMPSDVTAKIENGQIAVGFDTSNEEDLYVDRANQDLNLVISDEQNRAVSIVCFHEQPITITQNPEKTVATYLALLKSAGLNFEKDNKPLASQTGNVTAYEDRLQMLRFRPGRASDSGVD
jgi:hypothetical protein